MGVELGIGWASVGQKWVDWSESSAQDNGAEEDRWEDDGACSQMAEVRGAKAARRKAHGILLWCEMKPMEMTTWVPQRRMGVFLARWSPRNVFSGEKQFETIPTSLL